MDSGMISKLGVKNVEPSRGIIRSEIWILDS